MVVANNFCWNVTSDQCRVTYWLGPDENGVLLTENDLGVEYLRNFLHEGAYARNTPNEPSGAWQPFPPSHFGGGITTAFSWGAQNGAADSSFTFGVWTDVHGVPRVSPFDVCAENHPANGFAYVPELGPENTGPTWWDGPG